MDSDSLIEPLLTILPPSASILIGMLLLRRIWNFIDLFGKREVSSDLLLQDRSLYVACVPPFSSYVTTSLPLVSLNLSIYPPANPFLLRPSVRTHQTFFHASLSRHLNFWSPTLCRGPSRDLGASQSSFLRLKRKKAHWK